MNFSFLYVGSYRPALMHSYEYTSTMEVVMNIFFISALNELCMAVL